MTSNSSLLQWLATFELDGQPSVGFRDDAYYNLADGYVCARILNQISPQYFSGKWLDGIKPVPPNGSWRLRVSNLKRILQKIHDYASDLQSSQFRPSAITPDVAVIAQNFDPDQITRLIQLILFCAINCDKKEDYIEKIRNFPTQIKQDIKEAIEELLIKNHDSSYNQKLSTSHLGNDSVNLENEVDQSSSSNQSKILSPARSTGSRSFLRRDSSQSDTSRINENYVSNYQNETADELRQRLSGVIALKEEKAQACHELEIRLKELQLEKEQLVFENDRLSRERQPIIPSDSRRSQEATNTTKVENKDKDARLNYLEHENKRLQGLLQQLKEDLIRIETEKEDYRLKSNLLREDIDKISSKHEEFKNRAEQAKRLQDELDEHRHISEKVANYETTIENLVKKNNDLKKELKSIEEKNVSHIQRIVRLEEDNNQLTDALSRAEIFRKQLREAQVKLSEETHRADKGEVELARLSEKYSSVKRENEKLYETTNRLIRSSRDANPESGELNQATINDNIDSEGDNGPNSTLVPTLELKERVARLEYENELLQNKLKVKREDEHTVLGGLLESANSRCTKLEIENRQARKKILMLEGHLRDLFNSSSQNGASTSNAVAAALSNENSSSDNTLALMNRVEELQRSLFQKEQELMESETKYKRNLQKAKDVMKNLNNSQSTISNSLQLSCISSASSYNSNSLDETNMLKQQLKDREEQLIDLEREFSEFKKLKEVHERLFISAFYGVTTQMQWRNAEKRLERTTLTSPPNTASSSMNHSKHSH